MPSSAARAGSGSRPNLAWRDLAPDENERNKRHLDGYTRIFPNGRTQVFHYRPPYTTRAARCGPRRSGLLTGETGDMARLRRSVQSFAAFARNVPTSEQQWPAWGVHEVLAHIVFWHEHYVRLLDAEVTGGEPPLLTGTFVQLNAAAVRQLADEAIEALARRLADAQAELERLAADPRTEEIQVQIKAGGRPWPWPAFVRRVEGHIRGHEADLGRRLRRSARSS